MKLFWKDKPELSYPTWIQSRIYDTAGRKQRWWNNHGFPNVTGRDIDYGESSDGINVPPNGRKYSSSLAAPLQIRFE